MVIEWVATMKREYRLNKADFQGLGWKVRLQQKRSYYFLTLVKELVLGNALKQGDEVYYYLVNCDGRKALMVFLDGKERPKEDSAGISEIYVK